MTLQESNRLRTERNRGYSRARYARRKAAGECVTCGDPMPVDASGDDAQCARCRASGAKWAREHPKGQPTPAALVRRRAATAARSRRSYWRRRAAGICACCGKRPPDPDRTSCGPCRKLRARRFQEYTLRNWLRSL